MWKNWVKYILLFAAMIIFYIDYDGWVSEYALILTVCLPLFSLLCSLPSVLGLKIVVSVREKCLRNEDNVILIALKSGGIDRAVLCKLSVKIYDLMSGTYSQEKLMLSQKTKHSIAIPTGHCGIYKCQITHGRAYDFLGLFSFPVKLPKEFTVEVDPVAACPIPAPDFSRFRAQAFHPKAGGGFSEIHEMRQYRPGDPIRAIHWKLSAKTDDLIIREAQESESKLAFVTLDLTTDRDKMDATLDNLQWVSEHLLSLGMRHNVCFEDADGFGLQCITVNDKDELQELIYGLMSKQIRRDAPMVSGHKLSRADWLYRIEPVREGDA